MAPNSVSILNALESERNISGIAGLTKFDGRIYDDRAGRDTGFGKYHEQIFRDQLIANTRLLQYYHKLGSEDRTACLMQKNALKALHKIYSLKLRPPNSSDSPPLETPLQLELLQIINRPYGIPTDNQHSASPNNIAGPDSPLWELHDWSLKLTRALIESGFLSIAMAKVIENHLTNLFDTIRGHYPGGLTSQRTLTALLAHCLYKLVKIIGNSDVAQRRLLSASFICDHLFPLACEFAAKEYPATAVDPIGHYELFEATGKLDEPAKWLDASGTSSGELLSGNQHGNDCNDSDDCDPHLLPPTHVCLEHLIYKLILSSSADIQNVVVEFLQRRILKDKHYDTGTIDFHTACHNAEPGKIALMNRIVALNVIGRVGTKLNLWDSISLPCLLTIPDLSLDCSLMKICKFQQVHFLNKRIDDGLRMELVQAYLCELICNLDVENSQDQRHKLFVILTKLASEFLCIAGQPESSGVMRETCLFYITPLERKSKLNFVKKIAALYLDHKIIEPLILVELLLNDGEVDNSLNKECEHHLTKVISSITDEMLELLPNKKNHMYRVVLLLLRLGTSSFSRSQPLLDETVDKLLKLNEICLLDEESREQVSFHCHPIIWYTWNWINLEFALKFPLKKQTQARALNLLDRILDKLVPSETIGPKLLSSASSLLGNLGFYEVTNTSRLYSGGNKGDNYNDRSLLLESAHRIGKICAMCESIEQRPDLISSCIMSTLMGWSHSSRSSSGVDYTRQRLVTLIFTKFDKYEAKENDRIDARRRSFKSALEVDDDDLMLFKTRDNILLALMAAFNYDPNFLGGYMSLSGCSASSRGSRAKKYVKLWLDLITRPNDPLWTKWLRQDSFTARSQVHISYQTLVNIHKAHVEGNLTFSLIGLKRQLNSARQAVLTWLSELNNKAIFCDSPLKVFYADSIRQLKAIGQF